MLVKVFHDNSPGYFVGTSDSNKNAIPQEKRKTKIVMLCLTFGIDIENITPRSSQGAFCRTTQVDHAKSCLERQVGPTNPPQDGDQGTDVYTIQGTMLSIVASLTCIQEFETLAVEFTKPTENDMLDDTIEFEYTQSPFINVFYLLGQMMAMEKEE